MEYAALISRQDAIAACAERKQGIRATRVAQRIADRLRRVQTASRPLSEQVKALTATLEAEVLENIALKEVSARQKDEIGELLKKIVAAA